MAEKYPLVLNGTNIEELQSGDSIAGAIDSVSEDTSPNLGGNLNTGSYNVSFGDNAQALFGAGNDLKIYHDGNNSYIRDLGTGNLRINADDLKLMTADDSASYLEGFNGGEVRIRYNNNIKLATTSTGISVTGNVTATSFTGDGSNLTGVDGGKLLQVHYWRVPATTVSTSGSWAWNTTPTRPNTYSVASTTFTRESSTSKVYGIASGHVDHYSAAGSPSVVCLLDVNNTLFGASYMHMRWQNNEPFHYGFAFEDDCTNHSDNANPVYYLNCHSAASNMYFSRMGDGSTPQNPFTIIFYEVEQ